jgi:positive regulator of sigma E activity
MTERGLVIDTSEEIAHVEVKKSKNCENCNACIIGEGRTMIAEVDNSIKAKKGDYVLVEVSSREAIKSWLLVFGLPLLALFVGVFLINSLATSMGFSSDNIGAIGGFALMLLVFVGVYYYSRYIRKNESHSLKIIKILKS